MNLHILPKIQQTLWEKLVGVKLVKEFYLAGGTAAALHLGHRESIDFDFFTEVEFPAGKLLEQLAELGQLSVEQQDSNTLLGTLAGVKVSFFKYPYPLLAETTKLNGIKVAGLSDIVPMKLIAVSQRGTKKDFIDVFYLLEAGWSLEAMFEVVEKKFKGVHYNKLQILKSLTYFEDAERDPEPRMLGEFSWERCKEKIRLATREAL